RRSRTLLPDRLVQPCRFCLRLHPELAMQPVAQSFVHFQSLSGPGTFNVGLHERPASALTQRIERQQSARGSSGALTGAGRKGLGNQSRQRLFGTMAEALPFNEQPVLEGGIAQADAVQQIAAIERSRLLESLRCAAA